MKKKLVAYQESAGGVLVDGDRILLIRARTRSGRLVWTLPKGRIERGERMWEAALREVREETGYHCRLKRRLKTTSYVFRSGPTLIRKRVHWFMVEPIRKFGRPNPREVVQTAWVSVETAHEQLEYRSDRGLLRLVEESLDGHAAD